MRGGAGANVKYLEGTPYAASLFLSTPSCLPNQLTSPGRGAFNPLPTLRPLPLTNQPSPCDTSRPCPIDNHH